MLLQERDVLLDQLFLEVDRVGGDDHPLLVADRPERRGEQIGEGLPCSGSGLDYGDLLLVERLGEVHRHAGLLGTMLVSGKRLRQHAVGRVETFDLRVGEALDDLARHCGDGLVAVFPGVVDDVEADPLVAEERGDLDVSLRWG